MEDSFPSVTHFALQLSGVSQILLSVLLIMSLTCWYLIVTKTVVSWRMRRHSRTIEDLFWNAPSIEKARCEMAARGTREPFSHLALQALHAHDYYDQLGTSQCRKAGPAVQFIARALHKVIHEETTRLEGGLLVLASIGATAPFVGLFGTVWSMYDTLSAIGTQGADALHGVAAPVGEALIMTAMGLAVAIPAVLGYNYFVRFNRVYLTRLNSFAHDLFAHLTTEEAVSYAIPGMAATR